MAFTYCPLVAIRRDALEEMERARKQAPEVIRTFMKVRSVTQQQLGEAIGLTQTQLSRRLAVAGSLSHAPAAPLGPRHHERRHRRPACNPDLRPPLEARDDVSLHSNDSPAAAGGRRDAGLLRREAA